MVFGLVIGTDRALALQNVIQDELAKRGFSSEPDPVMAEYITIMMINNKTPTQITAELEDLIGSEYDASFTDWLFAEAAKGASDADIPPQASTSEQPVESTSSPKDVAPPSSNDVTRRAPPAGVYQQALSQAIPSTASAGHKRTASARSASPSHPSKSRRTDLPTGPRAMLRDGQPNGTSHSGSRSLADRISGPTAPMRNNHRQDEIQARIDNIVNNNNNATPDPNNMMMAGGFGGGMGMPAGIPNGMEMGMANPLMLQEMMMNQMALMAQMATSMGMLNPAAAQYGMPMQGMPGGDMGMFPGGNMGGFQGLQQANGHVGGPERGRGRGRGSTRGRGGHTTSEAQPIETNGTTTDTPIVAPTPTPAAPTPAAVAAPAQPQRTTYALPERPQTPSLCKFGLKCTNPHCRYSHPSPVATPESGVVLSNEACENGKDCKDKDCIKAHVSPAVLNPNASEQPPPTAPQPVAAPPPRQHHSPSNAIPCRFGAQCTRPNCVFSHPPRLSTTQCRFGAGCTRATCPYQHPEGRVLPTSFHRGLSTNAPLVNVQSPEPGSMGGPSPHKSVKFNNNSAASVKERLKEIEEKKSQAEKAVKEAEAAANANKKDDSKPVAIAAA